MRDGIAFVTFNRPQARNALTFAMYERLAEICAEVNEDRSIRAMILTGAGDKAFAAGTDISQFRAFDKAEDALAYEARIDRVLDRSSAAACRRSPRSPAPAPAAGPGSRPAAICASRPAMPVRPPDRTHARQLPVDVRTMRALRALIGPARVKDMIFTARLIEAPEALAIGLVNEVVEIQALLQPRRGAGRTVASHAPLTLAGHQGGAAPPAPAMPRGEGR